MEIITVIAVVVTLAAVWWSVGHAQTAREALAAVREELEATKAQKDANKSKSKKSGQADQSALKSELSSVKKDLNQAKKKAHEAQVELKAELERERASRRELEKRLNESPAFQTDDAKNAKTKEEPKVPAHVEALNTETTEARVIEEPVSEELTEGERTKKDGLIAKLKTEKGELMDAQKGLKRELKDAKYKVERYRRIDLVKQREHELVDDRLLTMGRLYYDAVSEIAALKGDVVPPKPRELREAEARAAERAAKEAKAEARKAQDLEDEEQATSINDAMKQEEQAQIENLESAAKDEGTDDAPEPASAEVQAEASAEMPAPATSSEAQAAPAS